jgi:hypothetical protein
MDSYAFDGKHEWDRSAAGWSDVSQLDRCTEHADLG